MATVGLLFIACLAGVVAAAVQREHLASSLKHAIQKGVTLYNNDTDIKDAMDLLQKHIRCCGVETYRDYLHNRHNSTMEKDSVPKSCCKTPSNCQFADLKQKNITVAGIYTKGCYNTILEHGKSSLWAIVGVAIGILMFQIVDLLAAYKLLKIFKENYEQFEG